MNIGDKILKLRKERGWTQEDLAEKLNVTRQTISNWETEQTVPDLYQAIDLSKAFDININELADLNNIIYKNDKVEANLELLFEIVLKNIKSTISELTYSTWFEDLKVNSIDNGVLIIEVPMKVHLNYIKNNYYDKIIEEFNKVSISKIKEVKLILNNSYQNEYEKRFEERKNYEEWSEFGDWRKRLKDNISKYNNDYTKAVINTALEEKSDYLNPIYIYNSNCEILEQSFKYIQQTSRNKKIDYVVINAKDINKEYINKTLNEVFELFNSTSFVFFKDIHELNNDLNTRQLLFEIFNQLYNEGIHMIISSNSHPEELENVDERIKSRFMWGLVIEC